MLFSFVFENAPILPNVSKLCVRFKLWSRLRFSDTEYRYSNYHRPAGVMVYKILSRKYVLHGKSTFEISSRKHIQLFCYDTYLSARGKMN